ncbi:hypothetical protein [Nocardia wallacei]|uniref:hypothetical protein n=1 Tax=Nocardia wallacei TaxID=480035 RepID=UPI002454EDB5|nr:hypothetical protein [Nocardia wallacei]
MSYLEKIEQRLVALAGTVTGAVSRGGPAQTLTIGAPAAEVERFWREPDKLSAVFDGVADVHETGPGRYRWTFPHAPDQAAWDTELLAEGGGLRFVGIEDDDSGRRGPQIRLTFRDAPHDLGTEVTLYARTPLPDILTGPAVFAVLYRARALLQTGEIPTLAHNPSARAAH